MKSITRRNFVIKAGAGLLTVGTSTMLFQENLYGNTDEKTANNDLFKVSFAGYTFRHYDLDTTLNMMQRMDVHYLCIKDFHLPLTSSEKEIADFHTKLASKNVTGYAVGPIYMKTEDEADKAFAYAKKLGIKLIVGVPNYELLPYIDKK